MLGNIWLPGTNAVAESWQEQENIQSIIWTKKLWYRTANTYYQNHTEMFIVARDFYKDPTR